jgi:hypothetical protein
VVDFAAIALVAAALVATVALLATVALIAVAFGFTVPEVENSTTALFAAA